MSRSWKRGARSGLGRRWRVTPGSLPFHPASGVGSATFLAGAFLATTFLAGTFFAADFFAGCALLDADSRLAGAGLRGRPAAVVAVDLD